MFHGTLDAPDERDPGTSGVARAHVGARNHHAALSRTSVAIAALMVAISTTIGVTIMIESFPVDRRELVRADAHRRRVYYAPLIGANRGSTMSAALQDRIVGLSGVSRVDILRDVNAFSPEFGDVHLVAASTARNRVSSPAACGAGENGSGGCAVGTRATSL